MTVSIDVPREKAADVLANVRSVPGLRVEHIETRARGTLHIVVPMNRLDVLTERVTASSGRDFVLHVGGTRSPTPHLHSSASASGAVISSPGASGGENASPEGEIEAGAAGACTEATPARSAAHAGPAKPVGMLFETARVSLPVPSPIGRGRDPTPRSPAALGPPEGGGGAGEGGAQTLSATGTVSALSGDRGAHWNAQAHSAHASTTGAPAAAGAAGAAGGALLDGPWEERFQSFRRLEEMLRATARLRPLKRWELAVANGFRDGMAFLLDRGAVDVNQPLAGRRTALHVAAERLDSRTIRYLLARGADPGRRDARGLRPQDVGRLKVARAEAVARASPTARAVQYLRLCRRCAALLTGVSLHRAAKEGDLEQVRALLETGERRDADARNAYGMTALHLAALHSRRHVVGYLLDRGADPTAENARGQSAIFLARDPQVEAALRAAARQLLDARERAARERGDARARAERARREREAAVRYVRVTTRGTSAALLPGGGYRDPRASIPARPLSATRRPASGAAHWLDRRVLSSHVEALFRAPHSPHSPGGGAPPPQRERPPSAMPLRRSRSSQESARGRT